LFTAGFLATKPASLPNLPHPNIVALMVGCAFFAIVGDQVGYLLGRRVGPKLFDRPDSRLFKQRYVEKAQKFFDRHGAKTIVLARFVPVVRTFTPVLAGISKMDYRTFVLFNVIGGVIWGAGVSALGYFLGQVDLIADNIETAVLTLVVVSFLPVAIELVRARRHRAPSLS
ncbi:MAG: VTT domain-containing protein, partial [Acidimicrobiales bacterium]